MRASIKQSIFTRKNFRILSGSLIFLSAIVSTGALSVSAEASQAELQLGIQSFNSKHYSEAVGHLQQYVNAVPHESIGHYYLANCLFNLGYEKPSIEQYEMALKESTSQKMTDYCRDAIRTMQASKQATATTPALAQQAGLSLESALYQSGGYSRSPGLLRSSGSNRAAVPNQQLAYNSLSGVSSFSRVSPLSGMSQPLEIGSLSGVDQPSMDPSSRYSWATTLGRLPEYQRQTALTRMSQSARGTAMDSLGPNPLLTTPPVNLGIEIPHEGVVDLALEKTLVRMADQSNIEIETIQREYVADLASIKEHLTDDIFRLNRDRDARIQALNDGVRIKGSSSSDTVDSIRRDTDSKIAAATSASTATTQAHEQLFLARLVKIQSDLKVSQNQVADSRRMPGGQPNLQLAGSDLYTRNYTPSPTPPPPDELMATEERLILDAHSRPGRTISRVVRDPVETAPLAPGTDLKVHGQVIK